MKMLRAQAEPKDKRRRAFPAVLSIEEFEKRVERECFSAVISIVPEEVTAPVGRFIDGRVLEDFFTRSETVRQLAFIACFHTDSKTRLAATEYLGDKAVTEIFSVIEGSKYQDSRSAAVSQLERSMKKGSSFGLCPRTTYLISCLSHKSDIRSKALAQLDKEPFWGRSSASCLIEASVHTRFYDTSVEAANLAAKHYGRMEAVARPIIRSFVELVRPIILLKDSVKKVLDAWRRPNNTDIQDYGCID